MSTPKLHVRLNRGQDGKPYIAITRGQLAWIRVNLSEVPTICDQLMDIYEEQENTSDR